MASVKNRKWERTNKIRTTKKGLIKTREELHQAVQLVAAVARSYLPESEEDSHASLQWDKEKAMLLGKEIEGGDKLRAGLNLKKFTIHIFNVNTNQSFAVKCRNKSYKILAGSIVKYLAKNNFDTDKFSLEFPYKIPKYKTAKGKKFSGKHRAVLKELSNHFQNAAFILEEYKNMYESASEVKCWPHHFDIATSIVLQKKKAEKSYLGLGFSPGDQHLKTPYYYVNLWPVPSYNNLPKLPAGSWYSDDWFGAVLPSNSFKKIKKGKRQERILRKFYDRVIDHMMTYVNLK